MELSSAKGSYFKFKCIGPHIEKEVTILEVFLKI